MSLLLDQKMQPPTNPMKMAQYSLELSHPAVMLTNPASSPFAREDTHSMWSTTIVKMKTVRPPAAADRVVFMHTVWITREFAPVAPRAEPPLNPYHPNHKMNVPSTIRPTLCGRNSSLSVSGSNRPMRGPRKMAP